MNEVNPQNIVATCLRIAERAADDLGRVSVRRLCCELKAELVFRPLLVEAMLTSKGTESSQWTVFIDSETHSQSCLENEFSPLAKRLRNTVAHELIHTLGFKVRESKIDFKKKRGKNQSTSSMIAEIEAETEKYSPLLLLPTKAIRKLENCTDASSFSDFCNYFGLSKFALIGRLNLVHLIEEEKGLHFLQNIAVGILNGGKLKEWPLYFRFDRNIAPSFLWAMADGESIPLDSAFPGSSQKSKDIRTQTVSGTYLNRECEMMNIQFSVDPNGDKNKFFTIKPATEGSVEVQDMLNF